MWGVVGVRAWVEGARSVERDHSPALGVLHHTCSVVSGEAGGYMQVTHPVFSRSSARLPRVECWVAYAFSVSISGGDGLWRAGVSDECA